MAKATIKAEIEGGDAVDIELDPDSESEITDDSLAAPAAGGGGAGGGSAATGPSLVSMAQQFSGLPMHSLIGGPLNAAAEANQQMGLAQINFMLNTCFTKTAASGSTPESYSPILVRSKVTRPLVDKGTPTKSNPNPKVTVKEVYSTIEIPLLTLLPLNTLGVQHVDVDFIMNVKSSYSDEKDSSDETKAGASVSFSTSIDYFFAKTTIKGQASISTDHQDSDKAKYSKQNDATYHVHVTAGQLPMPPGVTTLITAFTNNIGVVTA